MMNARQDEVLDRLLARAADDPKIIGAALTGSIATGTADEWSDLDLALGVDDHDLTAALDDWTTIMVDQFGALHYWDLPSGNWIYRVFLLPDLLEIDLGFALAGDWGQRADSWQTVFGDPVDHRREPRAFDARSWTGHLWHHLLHARIAIERGRGLQAAYWIGAARELITESATRRSGLPTAYSKGAHRLPAELIAALEATLVASSGEAELRRALMALVEVATAEIERADPTDSQPLVSTLRQLSGSVDS